MGTYARDLPALAGYMLAAGLLIPAAGAGAPPAARPACAGLPAATGAAALKGAKDLGVRRARAGEFAAAEGCLLLARDLAPDRFEGWMNLGSLYLDWGK